MAGTDLDRFSRFSFDGFDSRLRGYPVGRAPLRPGRGRADGRRLERGARGPARPVRGHRASPTIRTGAGLARYSGVGPGVEAPLPWRTLLAAEWGYGFEGRDRDGSRGTHVFRVTAYKVF